MSLAATLVIFPRGVEAQVPDGFAKSEAILEREHPETYALVRRIERMQGLLFGKLAPEGEAVRARADSLPGPNFEFDMLDRLGGLATQEGTLEDAADEAEAGFESLGARAAGIIEWTSAFRRAVFGILADPNLTQFQDRKAAVAEAVALYQSRPEAALPTMPKNMDILYDHKDAQDFRRGYADLDGFIWAGHWLKLAATKPLVDLVGGERAAGLDTVQSRYYAKLSYGEPPEFFPSELPLAPAIAPEISFMSPETAVIWDNLTMLEEVLADILASPDVPDARAAINAAVTFFLDPALGVTDRLSFGAMALRHGIFFQGGFPLAVMTKSELNVGGHAAHLRGGVLTLPGM
jgi:hypothetical protein